MAGAATCTIVVSSRFIASASSSVASAAARVRGAAVVVMRPTLGSGGVIGTQSAIRSAYYSSRAVSLKDFHMLDPVDSALVHALRIDGRASYARIGEVLGVSTQTVARPSIR
ncbi:AsnC family protein, partial [Sciscionella sediminilitoris]|uniref:AsnC family protein n=1 Tax=Sciscionella sediminilitoris TaxID=1445613 RepID=UPI003CCD485B